MKFSKVCVFLVAALAVIDASAQPVEVAGTVTLLNGRATAQGADLKSRTLAKGDSVYAGDTVETERGSYLLIRFTDEGSTLLRPRSKFAIESYHYAAAPAANTPATAGTSVIAAAPAEPESSFFRLLRGGLRAVSGAIAHANYSHYRMTTAVATMGIRGTEYVAVECGDECTSDPELMKALNEQNISAAEVTDDADIINVAQGSITIQSSKGVPVTLTAGQSAMVLADGQIVLLDFTPALVTSTSAEAAEGVETAGSAATVGGAQAAASAAIVGGTIMGVTAAALFGIVLSTANNNGTNGTTQSIGHAQPAGAH